MPTLEWRTKAKHKKLHFLLLATLDGTLFDLLWQLMAMVVCVFLSSG
jgi:hypothetical protein